MKKIVTTGKRFLKDDRWHDDNGPLPGHPGLWDPPMTEEEVMIAALSDPDAQPSTPEQLARGRRIAYATHVRFKLGLSQEEFARRFTIPLGTLRDWEQHRTEPDQAAQSYLKVREHSLAKVPVILVVGKREAEERKVSIRRLGSDKQSVLGLDEALELLSEEAMAPDLREGT